MVINEKDIELSKPNRFPPITVKQGDNARQITARLFNDGEQFLVTSGLGVRLNAKRSDGQKNYSTGWVNDDGTVTVQITSWMVAVVGTVTCDISVFISGQQAFTTTNFYLNVEEATNKDGVIGGNDTPVDEQFAEISLQIERYFEQMRGYVEQTKDYNEQAKQYAEQASTVDHIIEQNSGEPVKVWTTDDKQKFDDLETKEQNTLYVYPSDFDEEAVLNGTQKVGHAINADNADHATNAENATNAETAEKTNKIIMKSLAVGSTVTETGIYFVYMHSSLNSASIAVQQVFYIYNLSQGMIGAIADEGNKVPTVYVNYNSSTKKFETNNSAAQIKSIYYIPLV